MRNLATGALPRKFVRNEATRRSHCKPCREYRPSLFSLGIAIGMGGSPRLPTNRG